MEATWKNPPELQAQFKVIEERVTMLEQLLNGRMEQTSNSVTYFSTDGEVILKREW